MNSLRRLVERWHELSCMAHNMSVSENDIGDKCYRRGCSVTYKQSAYGLSCEVGKLERVLNAAQAISDYDIVKASSEQREPDYINALYDELRAALLEIQK